MTIEKINIFKTERHKQYLEWIARNYPSKRKATDKCKEGAEAMKDEFGELSVVPAWAIYPDGKKERHFVVQDIHGDYFDPTYSQYAGDKISIELMDKSEPMYSAKVIQCFECEEFYYSCEKHTCSKDKCGTCALWRNTCYYMDKNDRACSSFKPLTTQLEA